MSREIKFRCWDKFEKRMYKIEKISWDCFGVINCIGVYINDSLCKSYVKKHNIERHDITALEIMQYTGLKDKNGKEIYEGDIVHIPDDWEEYGWASGENYAIDFKEGRFRLKPKYKPNAIGYDLEHTDELEVIGNIYDNPELLKGEQS